jgi:hypothetical protein
MRQWNPGQSWLTTAEVMSFAGDCTEDRISSTRLVRLYLQIGSVRDPGMSGFSREELVSSYSDSPAEPPSNF